MYHYHPWVVIIIFLFGVNKEMRKEFDSKEEAVEYRNKIDSLRRIDRTWHIDTVKVDTNIVTEIY